MRKHIFLFTFLVGSLALLWASFAAAAVPSSFAVEGVLRDGAGKLQSAMVNVTVSLWNDETVGNKLAGPYGPMLATVENGLFHVNIDDPSLQSELSGPAQVWLEVVIGNDTFPRQRVQPQLFSILCGTADRLSGTLPVAGGGTGSTTQNFVDLTTNQSIAGQKSFTAGVSVPSIQVGASGPISYNWWEFGADDNGGAGIDLHGAATYTDFAARVYRVNGDDGDFHIENQGAGSIQLRNSGGQNRVTIAANGNVGIGNTNPTHTLDVAGPTVFDSIHIFRKGGNNGTASCATFCAGAGWGEVGACLAGKNEGTGAYDYGCTNTLGGLPTITCLCASYP